MSFSRQLMSTYCDWGWNFSEIYVVMRELIF